MLVTGPAPLSVDGAAVGHGLPQRQLPLGELQAMLLHPATGRAARDAVWRRVVAEAHSGSPAWVLGAVGLALPALWRMAGDLAEGYRGEPADLHAALLTGFVDALHRVDTSRPGIITRLRWSAYRAGLLARYTRQGVAPMPLPPLESSPPPPPWSHPDLLLVDAVAKGVLSPLAAELIGRSRLEDLTLKQAAAELGVGVQAAYKARQRGERRLVAALASGEVEHRVSNPDRDRGLFLVRAADARRAQDRRPSPAEGSRAGLGPRPPGVRGRSTRSDGTTDPEHPHNEGGEAFCGPARQSPAAPQPSSSSAFSSPASLSRSGRRRRRGDSRGRGRGAPGDSRGTQ
ncbi:hypothetical protein [Actinomadura sp. 3N407]|uniref:hypothetical protein n=1 Tax=Actinomadura sp. 3N407 TaxID=3457423 RepID=UPI003FCD7A72